MDRWFGYHSVLNMKVLVASRHFQPGEGPNRGLLHDCETDGSSAAAALVNLELTKVRRDGACKKIFFITSALSETIKISSFPSSANALP